MERAEVTKLLLCHRGDIFTKALSFVQFFAPMIIQAAIWGLSLKNRDPFLFVVHNCYTWLFYYILLLLRDFVVRSPRPFRVIECDKSFAVPDPWFCITSSFLVTMIVCSLYYRRRTFWRLISAGLLTFGLVFYLTAPIVNGYYTAWQYVFNMLVVGLLSLMVIFFIWLWIADAFVGLMRYRLPHRLGFSMCFLSDYASGTEEQLQLEEQERKKKKKVIHWIAN